MSDTTSPRVAAAGTTPDAAAGARPLKRAEAAFDAVYSDPRRAEEQLRAVLATIERAPAPTDRHAEVIALWGLARVRHTDGAHGEAVDLFERAMEAARSAGLTDDLANIRISAAVTFQVAGDSERALRELDLAEPSLDEAGRGRWAGQRALVLLNLGRAEEALHAFDAAIRTLIGSDDRVALARTYTNRGVTHLQRAAYDAARRDLDRAAELSTAAGEHVVTAIALHNLGYLEARLGHIPAALGHYERARAEFQSFGSAGRLLSSLDIDHAEICLAVGLAPEALTIADGQIAASQSSGDMLRLGEARLIRVRALSLLGDHAGAAEEADRAATAFAANERLPWASIASYLGAVASIQADTEERSAAVDARLAQVAADLARHGWCNEAAEVLTVRGRLAVERGDLAAAQQHLRSAARTQRRASAGQRAQAALARALLHEADGNATNALRHARHGLDAVGTQRDGLGSSELRAAASAAGTPLVELGLRISLNRQRPAEVLRWAERGRAASMTAPATAPPEDQRLAARLTELRSLHVARAAGESVEQRISAVELDILRLRRLDHGQPAHAVDRLTLTAIRAGLGGATLVEYVASDGMLHAVVIDARRSSIVALGSLDDVRAAVDHLLFALRRLSVLPADHRRRAAARDTLEREADALDRFLLGPLEVGNAAQLVVVPSGPLHALPWLTLPSARRCAAQVAPSATWWLAGDRHRDTAVNGRATEVLIVGGPDLDHVAAEMSVLDAHYSRNPSRNASRHIIVSGPKATVANVLRRLESADLAHIAAHGLFRADSPMFSALQMHDGPLNVHDLQGLRQVPRLVVLTACDAGRNGVLTGDELLGTVAALLSLGVHAVIAPLLPIADHAAVRFAAALHHELAQGRSPVTALAEVASQAQASADDGFVAVAQSFLCIGTSASATIRINPPPPHSVSAR